ncbi:VOC family protein [Oscillatoria sp. CS-180]|uniref:VOC family protein n=1 Tax=Oscillatoria sp. CS-180 TaxID=3021720 RepID=UPI00232FBE14|nr:VOC family protein [Oscillatoria sp. CS-180]MDB9528739.1 VOC family protein [Oscillatoria sp. CS-180]
MSLANCKEAYIALATQRLQASVDFYRAVLKSDPAVWVSQSYAEFWIAGLKLALFQPRPSNREFSNSTGSKMSLCIEVEDLDAAIAHLSSLGHAPPGPIMTASHGREIYAYDPDGNRLILHQAQSN